MEAKVIFNGDGFLLALERKQLEQICNSQKQMSYFKH